MEKVEKLDIQFFVTSIITVLAIEFAFPMLLAIQPAISNLKVYVSVFFLACVTWGLVFLLSKCIVTINAIQTTYKTCGYCFFIFAVTLSLVFLVLYFNKGLKFYGYEAWITFPKHLSYIAIFLFCIFLYPNLKNITTKPKAYFILIYGTAATLYAISRYFPNILAADIYDADAWCDSIHNVASNIPYTFDTTGIYGHYAIFFKIPMMIFGSSFIVISKLIAIISFVTMLAYCYGVHKLIKNTLIRLLCIGSALLEPLYILPDSYFCTSPGRYFFPMLLVAYLAYLQQKDMSRKKVLFGIFFNSLAILWNFESGIACAFAFSWYCFLRTQNFNKIKVKDFVKIVCIVLAIPLEILFAVVYTNIYNWLVGGPAIVKAFFYPFTSHFYQFALPLKQGIYSYSFIIPFCFVNFTGGGGYKMIRFSSSPLPALISAISVIIFVQYAYYMNRFASCNVFIIIWLLALLMGVFLEQYKSDFFSIIHNKKRIYCNASQGAKAALAIICYVILCSLTLANLFSPSKQLQIYSNGVYNTKALKDYALEIASVVPKNTYAAGGGTKVLYSVLGWDSGYYINDYPNITARKEVVEKFIADINTKDSIFVESSIIDCKYISLDNYVFQFRFNFGNRIYYYLSKYPLILDETE